MNTFTKCASIFFCCLALKVNAQFQFLSPLPGSIDHNTNRNIIIREGSKLNASSLQKKNVFEIDGSLSGKHDFDVVLCRDQKTVLLNPRTPFDDGETVTVTVHEGIEKENGEKVNGFQYSFKTTRKLSDEEREQEKKAIEEVYGKEFGKSWTDDQTEDGPDGVKLPKFHITINNNPAPGDIFFHNYNIIGVPTGHHSIITNDGDSVYTGGSDKRGMDWKINHNGYLTMFYKPTSVWQMFDSSYNKVGVYKMQNGYLTDVHEIQVFPDGHAFVQAYDVHLVNMQVYDSSYSSNATVMALTIQELDADKNVIFEWRAFDHIGILEGQHQNFANNIIDYVHGNSIEQDADGNIVISCRHLDQINKIDINTGAFIWRLGGAMNQFTFLNDPEPFNYQHDCRVLPNGHITLFDNGNYHTVPCSYAREYALDLTNMTATLVWVYKHPMVAGAELTSAALGSVQRLDNGNTFIDWGSIPPNTTFPNLTEVTSDGEIVWEMRLDNTYNDVIYRAHKYKWDPCARPTSYKLRAKEITSTSANLKWDHTNGAHSYLVHYRPLGDSLWTTIQTSGLAIEKTVYQLLPATTYEWRMQSVCANNDTSTFTLIKEFVHPAIEGLTGPATKRS
jgi:hypothetical protein